MAIILRKHKIFFVPAAKIACSSIKHFFFEIENGWTFRPFVINGQRKFLHGFYRSGLPEKIPPDGVLQGMYRATMVREPVKRFLSAYSNRVVFHKELSVEKAGANLKALGLDPDPDVHLFITRLEEYQQAHPSIMRHTRPMTAFLGEDPGFYDRIYCISEMEDFRQDIAKRVGMDIQMPRLQTGGPKIDAGTLSADEIAKIKNIYRRDYELFGDFIKD